MDCTPKEGSRINQLKYCAKRKNTKNKLTSSQELFYYTECDG